MPGGILAASGRPVLQPPLEERVSEPPHELVATEIVCIECQRLWLLPSERWRLYLSDEKEPEPVAYCPDCAEREFD